MKFKTDRTLATPEAAEKKLLEIANAIGADHACRLSVAAINIRNFEMQAATPRSSSEEQITLMVLDLCSAAFVGVE
jgi:hypothetical protein